MRSASSLLRGSLLGVMHLALHTSLGMLGWLIGLVLMDMFPAPGHMWFNPAGWLPGLLMGFFMTRRFHHRAAILVWLVGAAWFDQFIAPYFHPESRSFALRGDGQRLLFPLRNMDCSIGECLAYSFGTLVAFSLLAYSVGAIFAFLVGMFTRSRDDS